jgi:hypothetical protein
MEGKAVTAFSNLFSCNKKYFVKHLPPFTDDGRKCTAKSVFTVKYGKYLPPPDGVEEGAHAPLEIADIEAHLNGTYGVAVTPCVVNDAGMAVCVYAAIDIDMQDDFVWLISALKRIGLKFVPCLSKSLGLHIYFVFNRAEEVEDVVSALKSVIALLSLDKVYKEGTVSKVEVFPQHSNKSGSNDKCLLLPYYNVNGSHCTQKVLRENGKTVGNLEKALVEFGGAMTSVEEIREAVENAPYADAPHCVQSLLLQGTLSERGCRNNFIFAVALFMKIKFKDGFIEHLQEANKLLREPLDSSEVGNICTSVLETDYPFTSCCKKEPCVGVCNKRRCREQQYGVGKQGKENYISNVGFQQLTKVLAEKPYYKLSVIKEGTTEGTIVTMDSAEELLSQDKTQLIILEQMNVLVETVRRDVWEGKVKDILRNIAEEVIEFDADNSEPAIFTKKFYEYLGMYQIQDGKKSRLLIGSVWHEGAASFFTSEGVDKFYSRLRRLRGVQNMHDFLVKRGCIPTTVIVGIDGRAVSVSCWRKDDDALFNKYCEMFKKMYHNVIADSDLADAYGGSVQKKEVEIADYEDTGEFQEDEGVRF